MNKRTPAKSKRPDIEVDNLRSFWSVAPCTTKGKSWVRNNLNTPDWQKDAGQVYVEHSYIADIVEAMRDAGLVVAPAGGES